MTVPLMLAPRACPETIVVQLSVRCGESRAAGDSEVKPIGLILLAAPVMLTACQSDGRKPLLTASASRKIAAQCGVTVKDFSRDRSHLPYAVFDVPADEKSSDDEPSPTVRCLDSGLERYRHRWLAFD